MNDVNNHFSLSSFFLILPVNDDDDDDSDLLCKIVTENI